MPKRLTDEELSELKVWLTDQQINPNKMHREFSDAVPVANLLKRLYPKLIDLHNYPSRNNTQLKLNNWETLNFKALGKIGLQQTKSMLQKLAAGTPGAIESLLYDIKMQSKAKQSDRIDDQELAWSENDDIIAVNVSKKIGDAIVQVPQKMILYSIYESAIRESQAKDSYLNAANQKIAHLENILKLKAERIEELCAQLAKVSVRSLIKQHNFENSSPKSLLNFDNIENETNSKNIDY
ncbi:PREDICTED: sperm flagellar protein 1 [Bactrocera latifrons]|uniref:Sperm flagellar protein 1 n=3 Tax=Bactrocera latifrons TaxID=174628 RepID=A0A0K8VRL8_BACLA|nr:PREDICTED: sperm flagellar protein 1 [Bactrocera latifrons]